MKRIFSLAVSIALSVSLLAAVPVVSYAEEPQPPAATEPDPTDPGAPTDPTDPNSGSSGTSQQPDEYGVSPCAIDSPNDYP